MQLKLTGHHVEITASLRDYVETKLEKLERHFDHINSVNVVFTVEKKDQIAEGTVHLNGNEVFASAHNADMYHAIDSLVDKLDRQILKHKGKVTQH